MCLTTGVRYWEVSSSRLSPGVIPRAGSRGSRYPPPSLPTTAPDRLQGFMASCRVNRAWWPYFPPELEVAVRARRQPHEQGSSPPGVDLSQTPASSPIHQLLVHKLTDARWSQIPAPPLQSVRSWRPRTCAKLRDAGGAPLVGSLPALLTGSLREPPSLTWCPLHQWACLPSPFLPPRLSSLFPDPGPPCCLRERLFTQSLLFPAFLSPLGSFSLFFLPRFSLASPGLWSSVPLSPSPPEYAFLSGLTTPLSPSLFPGSLGLPCSLSPLQGCKASADRPAEAWAQPHRQKGASFTVSVGAAQGGPAVPRTETGMEHAATGRWRVTLFCLKLP